MNLNISEINNMRPLLLLYSSGTGGEFITKTLAANSNEFNNVDYYLNSEDNLTSTRCCIHYSAMWQDPTDPFTWIDNTVTAQDKSKRVIIKDHPSLYFAKYYWKHLSNLKVIHLAVKEEVNFFSNLTINKLAHRVHSNNLSDLHINKYISETATPKRIEQLINWAKSYPWVWSTELHTLNSHLSNSVNTSEFIHNDNIDILVKNQIDAISWESGRLRTFLEDIYDNYTTVYLDSLAHDGVDFWNQIKNCVPDLEVSKCIEQTSYWIENNKKIIERGPKHL